MTRLRWAPPEWHESIGSTNLEALDDPRPGRVVVADHQSAGQGRRGRAWSSPPGSGMAISAVLPPVPSRVAGWVPLAAGLAVVRALASSRWPVEATLKWPNDVLITSGPRPGKVCGVLVQVAPNQALVVGAGINIDHDADQLPVPAATSWRLARGGAVLPEGAREDVLRDYLAALADLHAELADGDCRPVATAYRAACGTLGTEVVVERPDGGRTQGRATEVADDGALVVLGADGARTVHHAGDVVHLRAR